MSQELAATSKRLHEALSPSSVQLSQLFETPSTQRVNLKQQGKLYEILEAKLEYYDGIAMRLFQLEDIPEILQRVSFMHLYLGIDYPDSDPRDYAITYRGVEYKWNDPRLNQIIRANLLGVDIATDPTQPLDANQVAFLIAETQDSVANELVAIHKDMFDLDQGFSPTGYSPEDIVELSQGTPMQPIIHMPGGKKKSPGKKGSKGVKTPIQLSQYERRYPEPRRKRTTPEQEIQRKPPVITTKPVNKRRKSSVAEPPPRTGPPATGGEKVMVNPSTPSDDGFDLPMGQNTPPSREPPATQSYFNTQIPDHINSEAPQNLIRYPVDPAVVRSPFYFPDEMRKLNNMENHRVQHIRSYHDNIRQIYLNDIKDKTFDPPKEWLQSKNIKWNIPKGEVLLWYMSPESQPYPRKMRGNTAGTMPRHSDPYIGSKPFMGKRCWDEFVAWVHVMEDIKHYRVYGGPEDYYPTCFLLEEQTGQNPQAEEAAIKASIPPQVEVARVFPWVLEDIDKKFESASKKRKVLEAVVQEIHNSPIAAEMMVPASSPPPNSPVKTDYFTLANLEALKKQSIELHVEREQYQKLYKEHVLDKPRAAEAMQELKRVVRELNELRREIMDLEDWLERENSPT